MKGGIKIICQPARVEPSLVIVNQRQGAKFPHGKCVYVLCLGDCICVTMWAVTEI